ncbi:MAG: hypothetical protein K9K81_11945, partial [Desulfobacteraceae bacterium]|nr:hypothetical protein [Desulfobacteraceae bacterium]
MSYTGPLSPRYMEAMYERWKSDPDAVDRDWQFFFQGFELGRS